MSIHRSPHLPQGLRVRVHFNLHNRLFSVTGRSGITAGKVIANVKTILLRDVAFKVSASGRARAQHAGQRSVHAWVLGEVVEVNEEYDLTHMVPITYSPLRDRPSTFATTDGTPVVYLSRALFARPPWKPEHGYAFWFVGPPPAASA